jgi:hypothetical protein
MSTSISTNEQCRHCGSQLHLQTTKTGKWYLASNSGSAFCVWPMQHMRHDLGRQQQ